MPVIKKFQHIKQNTIIFLNQTKILIKVEQLIKLNLITYRLEETKGRKTVIAQSMI